MSSKLINFNILHEVLSDNIMKYLTNEADKGSCILRNWCMDRQKTYSNSVIALIRVSYVLPQESKISMQTLIEIRTGNSALKV